MAFILLYRFDEAQLVKVISPFLLDSRAAGGLGLTTSQVGLAYGTFGILALTCGGLLGGFAAAKYGLKRMLPIMVASMYLPKLAFVFLSWTQPANFLITCGAVATEQFGYGFGFTAFMLYMLSLRRRPAQDRPLRHLHRLHGAGDDGARHVERLGGGPRRLQALLRVGHLLRPARLHPRPAPEPEDGPRIRQEDKPLTLLLHEQRQRRRVAVQEALLAHRPDLAVAEEAGQTHRP